MEIWTRRRDDGAAISGRTIIPARVADRLQTAVLPLLTKNQRTAKAARDGRPGLRFDLNRSCFEAFQPRHEYFSDK